MSESNNYMPESTPPPMWFTIVAVIAVIWNAIGVMAYLAQAYMTPEALAELPEAEQALYVAYPAWATAAFAIAVFGGTIGALLLLFRKKLAKKILILSLVGVVVQMIYNLGMSDAMAVYGPGQMIMPIMVLIISIALIWMAKVGQEKGWLS